MDTRLSYVKAFECKCGCAWTIEKSDPEYCWNCNSLGPHTIRTTCENTPKYLTIISDLSEEILFSQIEDNGVEL